MNRIKELFEHKQSGIISVYFTAGYPDRDNTAEVIMALQEGGVDMIEVGIPFSDPMADGPIIQNASTESLRGGMSLSLLFNQLKNLKGQVRIPLVMMGYLNPIMQYGFEAFCRKCSEVGVAGVIIPDLPMEEYISQYKSIMLRYGLCPVMLITPETSPERIREIDRHTDGFIYMVSAASVTGERKAFSAATMDYFRSVGELDLRNPRLVGFGISNKETFEAASIHASGAIIGSKFVSLLAENTPGQAVRKLLDAFR